MQEIGLMMGGAHGIEAAHDMDAGHGMGAVHV
jgi:hypothetical protein